MEINGKKYQKVGECYIPYQVETKTIKCPEDALPFLKSIMNKKQEVFHVIALNTDASISAQKTLFVGSLAECPIHAREVFQFALKNNASSLLVAHNHPSGTLAISVDDKRVTRALVSAGKLMGIPLMDHIVVSKNGFTSIRKQYKDFF